MTDQECFFGSRYCTARACLKDWIIKSQIGEGLTATVHDACLQGI